MSAAILTLGDVEAEEELLFSNKPELRLLGRMIATGWPKAVADWVTAELDRGTDQELVMKTFFTFAVQISGGMAGSLLRQPGHAVARDNLRRMVDVMFLDAATSAHAAQKAMRAGRAGS